jgi:xanthine dehydrogenase/oxidase
VFKFNFKVGKGTPFNYFTYGASFSEVEIDTLTGDFHTRSADIVMDLGRSLNSAIDIGQVICSWNILDSLQNLYSKS